MRNRDRAIAEVFSKNLVELRHAAGMTQEELSFRAGVHRSQVTMMEGGERMPRFDTLVKLTGALEVSSDDLLKGIKWRPVQAVKGGFRFTEADERA